MGLLSVRMLLDFGMALSTAVLIAIRIKSAYLSRSLVDVSPESPRNPAQPRVLIRILLCQSEIIESMCNAVYGPDSEIEIYMNLTFTVFPIMPCKLAGHVNVC